MTRIEKPGPKPVPLRSTRHRALILTHRSQDLISLTRHLTDALDMECTCLADPEAAAKAIGSNRCEIMFLDLADGHDAAEQLMRTMRNQRTTGHAAIIALGRAHDQNFVRRAVGIGAEDAFDIDASLELLTMSVRNAIERQTLRSAALTYWSQTALDHEGRHAANVLQALPEAVLVLGRDSIVEMANDEATQLFGMSNSSLIGSHIGGLLSRTVAVPNAPAITADLLLGHLSNSLFMVTSQAGPTKPVALRARPYTWFGQRMCVCLLSEVGWNQARIPATTAEELKSAAQLWSDIAGEALRRLDEAQRHVSIMRDQVFGPTGAPIYRSFLTDTLCCLDQATHLLGQKSSGNSDRRTTQQSATPFAQMAAEALSRCQAISSTRQVAHSVEFAPENLELRLPQERFVELLASLLCFATQATECGETITLRAQVASDRRLLLIVDAGGVAMAPTHLSRCCGKSPEPEIAAVPLTVAWNDARAAARRLGGQIELSLDHPRGGFNLMAFLPQRRLGDAA